MEMVIKKSLKNYKILRGLDVADTLPLHFIQKHKI